MLAWAAMLAPVGGNKPSPGRPCQWAAKPVLCDYLRLAVLSTGQPVSCSSWQEAVSCAFAWAGLLSHSRLPAANLLSSAGL